ncbi:hypothetical protein QTP88_012653 [Uroleucon formosanum]
MSHSVLFYEKLKSIYDNQDKKKPWSQEDYDKALNEINDAKLNPGKTKTQNQYYLCRKYDLIEDHATKYLYLRPLTSKRATEVAHELLKIFLEQGAPQILQSDNGREFTAKIIEELAELSFAISSLVWH